MLYIKHHGIKRQRWGYRRFQNRDGSLTAAGRARYGVGESGEMSSAGRSLREQDSADHEARTRSTSEVLNRSGQLLNDTSKIGEKNYKSIKTKKDYSNMTDEELRNRVNRLSLEENYGRLSGDTKMKRSGSDWTREILQTVGTVVAIAGGAVGIYIGLKNMPKKPE